MTDRVSVSDTEVKVTLGDDWRKGGQLVIVLNNVTVGVPSRLTDTTYVDTNTDGEQGTGEPDIHYTNVGFTPSSRASGGVLINLRPILIDDNGDDADDDGLVDASPPAGLTEDDPASPKVSSKHPRVRVGNILGTLTALNADTANDTLERAVEIEPDTTYTGITKETFVITFTAPGPMYDSQIRVTIPEQLIPDGVPNDADYIDDNIRVSSSSRVKRGETEPAISASGGFEVVINVERIDTDGQVHITYVYNDGAGIPVGYRTLDTPDAPDVPDESAFTVQTKVPDQDDPANVTKIEGGDVDPLEGSGTLTVKAPADAVAPVSPSGHAGYTLILEYTAPTPREGVTLTITPPADLANAEFLVKANISGSRRGIPDVLDGVITWTELDFNSKAGFTFTTTIEKATISEPGVYAWSCERW